MREQASGLRSLINAKEAAAYIGVSYTHLLRFIGVRKDKHIKAPKIPYYHIGQRYYFEPKDIDAWIEKQKRN